ncbi:hypothetical protein O7614_24655 [Micromonospora sp. WMMD961]|uniref:hypothetical protein n=1 Tax=Micromonospora sp. WMMD961 TaxID=3016100 RepID=UPI0024164A49|nr:hypothetical protein [Micromonospora sp. WMMD961]MDG4782858.1 hypothetical protein [Micromonospora sp. WMMD961]
MDQKHVANLMPAEVLQAELAMVNSGDSGRRLSVLGLMLLFTVILLPGIVGEGGWRAWIAVPASIGLVVVLLRELAAVIQRRRRPPQPERPDA